MTAANFPIALQFVWQPQFDGPPENYHVTPGDPGGGTKGGVTEATWDRALSVGFIAGSLEFATNDQLSEVLRTFCWGAACNTLPSGLDLLVFNGRMLSGHFPKILQQSLGFMGDDVDGWIGKDTLAAATAAQHDGSTLINAISGAHYAYLTTLDNWPTDKNGWTRRLKAAQAAALALVGKA